MGGWDYYCAICGGPLGPPYWETEEERGDDVDAEDEPFEPPAGYDPRIISSPQDAKLGWLRKFRAVTEVPEAYNKNAPEGWISGPCNEEMYGDAYMSFPPQDAHLFPGTDGWNQIMYGDDGDQPWAVPFHDDCHTLLLKYIGKDKLDADVFYETCKELAGQYGDTSRLGDLSYGDVSHAMEQYWGVYKDAEWMVLSPLDIPELTEFFNNPPQLPEVTGSQAELRGPRNHDPFSSFAPEIMMNIISSLNLESMGNFRLASRVARNVELGNHFWKKRVHQDMPWLFDIPSSVEKSPTVDWRRICGRMVHAARSPSKSLMRGLVNRRRIWKQMLPQIGSVYLVNLAVRQNDQAGEPEALVNARSTSSAMLVHPEPNDTKSHTVALLQTPHSIENAKVGIAICFNKEGEVYNIRVEDEKSTYDTEDAHTIEQMTIPDEAWITGLLVTTREARPVGIQVLLSEGESWDFGEVGEGGKRLIYVPKDNFVVGFRLHISSREELLCRIGLIYHQDWRSGSGSHRIWDYNNHDEKHNVDTTDKLWLNHLPPPKVLATEPYHGYWAHDMHTETSPFEALVLPTHYTERGDLVAVAADVQFGGFELRFANQPTRSIGPRRHALKTLKIDGKGGERIATVHICVHHIVTSIRIVTNRGRQLVIGQPDMREKRLPEGWPEGGNRLMCGIFGFWKNQDSSVKTTLDSVGALYSDFFSAEPYTEVSRQAGGLVWEPAPPPSETVAASGPILGSLQQEHSITTKEKNVPEDCNLLSWLDLSRPISSLRITTCHSLDINQLPLVSIQLEYADGNQEITAIGPSEFDPPTDTKAPKGDQYWCWCQLGVAKIKEELEAAPHYQHHEWEVGGKSISTLRVFIEPPRRRGAKGPVKGVTGAVITAIQFVAGDGTTSPVVGYWGREDEVEGEEMKEIKFGTGQSFGIKFFAGSNGRSVTREDHIVQALQALVRQG